MRRTKSPQPRCAPTRRDPLFGGWLVRDTVTGILLNSSGPWTAKGNDNSDFETRRQAQACADDWNRLMANQPRRLHPAYARYLKAQKGTVAA